MSEFTGWTAILSGEPKQTVTRMPIWMSSSGLKFTAELNKPPPPGKAEAHCNVPLPIYRFIRQRENRFAETLYRFET
jgi:hypothetical protein